MEGVVKKGVLENFMLSQQQSLKSLFQRKKKSLSNEDDSPSYSPRPIPQLSHLANSVVSRCSKILKVPSEELQHRFDIELPESVKQLFTYARNFVEFCSYQALHVATRCPDYLSDSEFRLLTYDMMLAWESPSVEIESDQNESPSYGTEEDEDGLSLFHFSSTNMAVQSISNLHLDEGEITVAVDGAVPTQPVLQHIGMSAWPGRLSLTNIALYFEPLGVGVYEKAVRYDLATDMKQLIPEPVYFEFPEFKGNSRRDYWLDICLEILRAHSRLALLNVGGAQHDMVGSPPAKQKQKLSPVAILTLNQLGFILQTETNLDGETIAVGDICVGETNPLEIAVKQSISDTGRAEAAQATVDQVKVEGIDTNAAVMKAEACIDQSDLEYMTGLWSLLVNRQVERLHLIAIGQVDNWLAVFNFWPLGKNLLSQQCFLVLSSYAIFKATDSCAIAGFSGCSDCIHAAESHNSNCISRGLHKGTPLQKESSDKLLRRVENGGLRYQQLLFS
ncbi:hypothetical protein EZV62_018751 [Acer yangbiense]|uniref:Uncharacterized protein n=1 Tax=Acer yangbiense TaxID=1000413 RepID=A0A5C7HKR2_9ROSI|nr:hypothetical protein EZV62_018751 [Acer yangbiense]